MSQQTGALIATVLMLLCPGTLLAQSAAPTSGNNPPVSFPSVTQPLPRPLLSASGRFSSLSPPNKVICHNSSASGLVVSSRLIRVDQFDCDDGGLGIGYHGCCSLMNVELSDPADAEKLVVGKSATIKGTFKSARENRGSYRVFYIIAEKARVLYGDPFDRPAQTGPSFMMCQPQELDQLANKLGREVCVQSSLLADLNVTGPMIEAAVKTPAQDTLVNVVSGDPAAISCWLDPEHTDAHLQSAVACARNRYWTWWVAKQRNPLLLGQAAPQ